MGININNNHIWPYLDESFDYSKVSLFSQKIFLYQGISVIVTAVFFHLQQKPGHQIVCVRLMFFLFTYGFITFFIGLIVLDSTLYSFSFCMHPYYTYKKKILFEWTWYSCYVEKCSNENEYLHRARYILDAFHRYLFRNMCISDEGMHSCFH